MAEPPLSSYESGAFVFLYSCPHLLPGLFFFFTKTTQKNSKLLLSGRLAGLIPRRNGDFRAQCHKDLCEVHRAHRLASGAHARPHPAQSVPSVEHSGPKIQQFTDSHNGRPQRDDPQRHQTESTAPEEDILPPPTSALLWKSSDKSSFFATRRGLPHTPPSSPV